MRGVCVTGVFRIICLKRNFRASDSRADDCAKPCVGASSRLRPVLVKPLQTFRRLVDQPIYLARSSHVLYTVSLLETLNAIPAPVYVRRNAEPGEKVQSIIAAL